MEVSDAPIQATQPPVSKAGPPTFDCAKPLHQNKRTQFFMDAKCIGAGYDSEDPDNGGPVELTLRPKRKGVVAAAPAPIDDDMFDAPAPTAHETTVFAVAKPEPKRVSEPSHGTSFFAVSNEYDDDDDDMPSMLGK